MQKQMQRLALAGVTKDQIISCVSGIPYFDGCLEAVRKAHAMAATQVILSDANSTFITAFLERKELGAAITEVFTNPAEFDAAGRLHVKPYHAEGHDCELCPTNLCKGRVLEELRAKLRPSCVVYVGDGGGDFCPVCDLTSADYVLCRAPPSPPLLRFGLHRKICQVMQPEDGREMPRTRHGHTATVAATVVRWHSGDEVLEFMCKLLGSEANRPVR
mmetsp:Transcript_6394/g.14042  ORF Transcript_6394/g.14042 Transcript_6394/m.14042 type:complete len:217 (+) Transcript_6394:216-866(+)